MLYHAHKAFSITAVSIALAVSGASFWRNLCVINNPAGAGMNLMTIIFLLAGIVLIARDQRKP